MWLHHRKRPYILQMFCFLDGSHVDMAHLRADSWFQLSYPLIVLLGFGVVGIPWEKMDFEAWATHGFARGNSGPNPTDSFWNCVFLINKVTLCFR